MKVAIYCRVSRKDLNLENQLTPCERRAKSEGWDYQIYTEKESSRNTRPVKEELLKQLRNREFDGVLVYSLDRWCRSVSEFAFELDEFRKRKIGFYSLREGFAFDTAMGQAMAQMAMVFAQLERELIRERTLAGLETARNLGKKLGRPRKTPSAEPTQNHIGTNAPPKTPVYLNDASLNKNEVTL
jgi:DNA invertase Pin-like site-specific DNA recombinase